MEVKKENGAEILALIDQYERDQKQEAEVLGNMRLPGDKREAWISASLLYLAESQLFENVDKFQGERIAGWLKQSGGKLTTTTWKAAWQVAKKYQKKLGEAPE